MFSKIKILSICGLLLCSTAGLAQSDENQNWETFDKIVEEGIEEKLYPGAVLVFGTPTEILYEKGYGHQTFAEDSKPVELDTIYDMASVTKVVATATMSLHLIEKGKLNLNEKVTETIPAFAQHEKESVTIHDLMTHTSGLKSYASYKVADAKRDEDTSQAQALINHYASLEKKYETRKDYIYSCLNFQTLASINEMKSSVDQETYLKENVYDKLGMNDTRFNLNEEQLARVAPSHRLASGEDARQEIHDPLARYYGSDGRMPGNAGLYSTGPDMAKFCQMVLNKGLQLSEDEKANWVFDGHTIEQATNVQTPLTLDEHRGLGFDIYEGTGYITDFNSVPGHFVVGHSGYTGTLFLIDQHTEKFMVLLTNRTYPADSEAVDQTPSVTPIRKALWNKFLHRQPEYQEFFLKQDAEQISSSN